LHQQSRQNLLKGKQTQLKDVPVLYQGEFEVTETGDTFIDMQNWGKGVIFVNGRNIGRFWKVGPQQTFTFRSMAEER
jgi:beta-galactosidase